MDIYRWFLVPTGEELIKGVVADTNCPKFIELLVEKYPTHEATRIAPVMDNKNSIMKTIKRAFEDEYDLVIIVGGSGGGVKYEASLNPDTSHEAVINYIEKNTEEGNYNYREIYGSNGHLLSKIVIGNCSQGTIINIPGPYKEALVSAKVIVNNFEYIKKGKTKKLLELIIEDILKTYN